MIKNNFDQRKLLIKTIDYLPYHPYLVNQVSEILSEVYGYDFQNPPIKHYPYLSDIFFKETFERRGFEEDINSSFPHEAPAAKSKEHLNINTFDENAKKDFLKGAEIAYETIVTNFSKGKLKDIKSLLDINVYEQFNNALDERKLNNYSSETTFIGINSAEIKHHEQNKNMLEVTVEFVSEIISCIRDKVC